MREKKELNLRFEKAVKVASDPDLRLPADIKLYLYAYYKHAVGGHSDLNRVFKEEEEPNTLVSGFKMNALFQAKAMSVSSAKQKYIDLVNSYLGENI